MAQGVMIIAEQREGDIRKISYELVSEGRRLADSLGQELTAILPGSNIKDKAAQLGNYGADKVLVADDPRLEKYNTDAVSEMILIPGVKSEDREKMAGQAISCSRPVGCRGGFFFSSLFSLRLTVFDSSVF